MKLSFNVNDRTQPDPFIFEDKSVFYLYVTADEGVFYGLLNGLSLFWSGALIFCSLMKIHDYTVSRTVISTVASIIGMLAIALLCLIFFSMFSEAIGYFSSLFQEIRIRIY